MSARARNPVRLSPDRLSLRGLQPTTRALALLLLLVLAAAILLVVLVAVGIVQELMRSDPAGVDWIGIVERLPLGSVIWLEFDQTVPLVSVVLLLSAASVIAAAVAHGVRLPGWPAPRLCAVGLTVSGVSLSTQLATKEAAVLQVAPPGSAAPTVFVVLGWVGVLGAATFLILTLVADRGAREPVARDRVAPIRMLLAATPFLCVLLAVMLVDATPGESGGSSPRVIAANVGLWAVELLLLSTQLVAMWGALALARAARRIATRITPADSDRAFKLLVLLLMIKGAWIAVGLGDRIPVEMTALHTAWARSRTLDGETAWLLAFAIALVLGTVAVRLRRRVSETGIRAATWFAVTAFSATMIAATVVLMAWPVAIVVPSVAYVPMAVTYQVTNDMVAAVPLTVVLAAPLLAVMLWRIGLRSAALMFGAIAVWATPRALAILDSLLQSGGGRAASALDRFIIEPVTMDVALTAVIALGTIGYARGWRLALPPALSMALLVTFSAVTFAGSLVPGGLEDLALCALLVYPVLWSLLFDSRPLNVPGRARAARVLAFLALTAGLLASSTFVIGAGAASFAVSLVPLTQIIVLLPYAALIVIAWWGQAQRLPSLDAPKEVVSPARRSPLPSLRPHRLPRREAAGWAATGTFVIVCLVGLTWLDIRFDPPRAFIPPGGVGSGTEGDPSDRSIRPPAHALPAGEPFDLVAHLRRVPRGTGITLRFTGGDPPRDPEDHEWSLLPGEDVVVLTVDPSDPMAQPGTWLMEAREGDEVLASGSYTVSS